MGVSQENLLPKKSLKTHTQIGVSLRIMGEVFDIEKLTEQLGVLPSETWYKGDLIRNTGKRRTYTAWIYNIDRLETLDIGILVFQIRTLFSEKTDKIVPLKNQYNLDIWIDFVVVVENQEPPAIYFDSDFISFAAQIGAQFDIDTYIN